MYFYAPSSLFKNVMPILLLLFLFCPPVIAKNKNENKKSEESEESSDAVLETVSLLESHIFGGPLWDETEKKLQKLIKKTRKNPWPTLEYKEKMEIGHVGPEVKILKERLKITGEYTEKIRKEDAEIFDEPLKLALEKFQESQGLNADGVVGELTRLALNRTPEEQLVALEKMRHDLEAQPTQLPKKGRHVVVNVPDFRLYLVEDDRVIDSMRVIVGGRYGHKTPLFQDEIEYMVINPKWHVPYRIASGEILPHLVKDPEYLKKQNMRIYEKDEAGQTVEVDSATVDWTKIKSNELNYHFSQDSGGGNALGYVKFIFPNQHSVYLHDTNSRYAFARDVRDLSHGCVRVEDPVKLADFLLFEDEKWDGKKVKALFGRTGERVLRLKNSIPVTIVSVPVWIDGAGEVQVRNDIYRTGGK